MYYIAFDQSSNDTGFSVYRDTKLIEYGKFKTKGFEFFDKVIETQEFMYSVIERYYQEGKKIKIALEDIQFQQRAGVDTFKRLAQLQGVLMVSIMRNFEAAEIEFIYASSWKSSTGVTGRDRTAQKRNAQAKVKELHEIDVTQDEADAILMGRHISHKEMNWE